VKLTTLGLIVAAALPATNCAQSPDRRPVQGQNGARRQGGSKPAQDTESDSDRTPRRLETVTWNSVRHELTWDVSKGEQRGAAYKPLGSDHYQISMDDATMSYNGTKRRFSKQEASNVHMLMDLIAKYAIDSTVWWDNGEGEPLDGNGNPKPDNKPQPGKKKDSDDATTVHVSFVRPSGATPAQNLHTRIEQMERQLQMLKQMERALQSLDSRAL
jgi:hypothetical protein